MLTHGSLFSGIGGFDLGFERAGIKTVWQVEIDPFCRKVLEKNFPDAKRFADIRDYQNLFVLEQPSIITGGFPCQDVSAANANGKGLDGQRSGLWTEMRRVVFLLRPRFVVVENVANLLNRGIERVLGDLAAIGYDAEWDVLPACAFGARHIRERVWILAYPNDARPSSERHLWPAGETGADSTGSSGERSEDVADTESIGGQIRESAEGRTGRFTSGCSDLANSDIQPAQRPTESWQERNPWATEPNVGRVAHGIPSRVDRLKGLGNAVVPQIAEWIGRRIIAAAGAEQS